MRCSVVLGVTLRLLVINISSSSPAINTAAYYQRCVHSGLVSHCGHQLNRQVADIVRMNVTDRQVYWHTDTKKKTERRVQGRVSQTD